MCVCIIKFDLNNTEIGFHVKCRFGVSGAGEQSL